MAADPVASAGPADASGPDGALRVAVLSGGVGGARFVRGLLHHLASPAAGRAAGARVTVVANTGDDITLHGLRVCPDIDTILYTLGGAVHEEQGWGRRDERSTVAEELAAYGAGPSWFTLGDRDIATHLVRTRMLGAGYDAVAGDRGAGGALAPGRRAAADVRPARGDPRARRRPGPPGGAPAGVVGADAGGGARARLPAARAGPGGRGPRRPGRAAGGRRRAAAAEQPGRLARAGPGRPRRPRRGARHPGPGGRREPAGRRRPRARDGRAVPGRARRALHLGRRGGAAGRPPRRLARRRRRPRADPPRRPGRAARRWLLGTDLLMRDVPGAARLAAEALDLALRLADGAAA